MECDCKISVNQNHIAGQRYDSYAIMIRPRVFKIYVEYLRACKMRLESSMKKKKDELIKFQNMDT